MSQKKTLSIFIDESGDFGSYQEHSPYYIVAMILHDQRNDISDNIKVFDYHLYNLGYANHVVHTAPLIRREDDYSNVLLEERRKLFNALFNFARKLDINYTTLDIDKEPGDDVISLTAKLSRALSDSIEKNKDFFDKFDNIIIYYDNGQVELTKILTSFFTALYKDIEFRKVIPADYKLFQVADLICTMELVSKKEDNNKLSKSEKDFFEETRKFDKNYKKPLKKKKIR